MVHESNNSWYVLTFSAVGGTLRVGPRGGRGRVGSPIRIDSSECWLNDTSCGTKKTLLLMFGEHYPVRIAIKQTLMLLEVVKRLTIDD